MINSFTIWKLDTIIPGFKDISEEEKISFISILRQEQTYREWISQKEHFQVDSSHASRQIQRLQTRQANTNFKNHLIQLPAYHQVCQAIIVKKIEDLGFNWNAFEKEEQAYLLNCEYSTLPFPHNWLDSFYKDNSDQIQKIKKKLFSRYYHSFGFLFLTQNLELFLKIEHETTKVSPAEKSKKLLYYLDCDWQRNGLFFSEAMQPVNNCFYNLNNYFQDLLEPCTQTFKKYTDEMMSAHLFYRLFGISSDNIILGFSLETGFPFINFFDYYLYHTNRKSIHSLMSVWQTLFKPLRPFFYEYVELAESEKNIIKICVRAFMPFFIMSMVLALGYAAILPLAYHQLIEYIFFIPAFYFSIIVASQYIQLKNYLYLNLIQWYFGSVHKIHLYDETPCLIEAMQSPKLAHAILAYYVNSLELCDTLSRTHEEKLNAALHQQNLVLKAELLDELNSFKKTDINPESLLTTIGNRLHHDKQQIRIFIEKFQHLFITSNETQIDKFKKDYLFLKNNYQDICQLETELHDLKLKESFALKL